jgi:hypothetical protein
MIMQKTKFYQNKKNEKKPFLGQNGLKMCKKYQKNYKKRPKTKMDDKLTYHPFL